MAERDRITEEERLDALRQWRGGFYCDPDESCGYDLDDPKHPSFHDRYADAYDNREKFSERK